RTGSSTPSSTTAPASPDPSPSPSASASCGTAASATATCCPAPNRTVPDKHVLGRMLRGGGPLAPRTRSSLGTSMTTRLSREEFLRNLRDSGLFSQEELAASLEALPEPQADGETLAQRLIAAGKLTPFQAVALRQRQFDELVIGNYQVLDRLGAG